MSRRVIAAVIEKEGRYLICKRPAHKHHGNLWEFPGGKLEPGESLAEAAARELKEELSLSVTRVGDTQLKVEDPQSTYIIEFVDVHTKGDVQLHEHAEYAWLTITELIEIPLAPSDRAFVEHLFKVASK